MNYKDTLFFIGKCLTITSDVQNRNEVEQELKLKKIDWDNVVKISTEHYVFPALFCNFERVNFLHYLPEELVEYMQHITNLNRERNKLIIDQASELNELLLSHNIIPTFLKGTSFILQELYKDIAERMVGDIDFLVDPSRLNDTVEILKSFGYTKLIKNEVYDSLIHRHYPRITKKGRVASVEVHYKMALRKKFQEFDYNFVKKNMIVKNNISFLSLEDNIIMTCVNKQINDFSDIHKNFSLRNSYDLFLLSTKKSTKNAIKKMEFHKCLNDFLFSSYNVLGKPLTLDFFKNKKTEYYYKKQIQLLNYPKAQKIRSYIIIFYLYCEHRIKITFKAFFKKSYRIFLINEIKSIFSFN